MNYLRKIAPVYAKPIEFCIGLVPQQFVRTVRPQRIPDQCVVLRDHPYKLSEDGERWQGRVAAQ
jgi:hypothetical protein